MGRTGLRRWTARFAIALLASAAVVGCSKDETTTEATLQSIAVTPVALTLKVGATQQLTVTGTYSDNTTKVETDGVTYTSSNTSVATVSATGLVTAATAGYSKISVAKDGLKVDVDCSVTTDQQKTLVSLKLSKETFTLAVGGTETLTVTGTYSDNSTGPVVEGIAWTADPETVATVNAGVVTAVAQGTATITAAVGDKSAQATVTVGAETSPIVFNGQYGSSIAFEGFGGSTNDVTIDSTVQHDGQDALKIVVPNGGYTGGTFKTSVPRDVSGYNAVTFWAKASKATNFDKVGIGNTNTASSPFNAEMAPVALTTDWVKYTMPLPLPSKLTALDGLFHFATGGADYTVWMADIEYVTVASITGPSSAAMATETVQKAAGATATVNGLVAIFTIDAATITIAPCAPRYFTFASSNESVATVDAEGVVTAVAGGTAEITAKLGTLDVNGKLTLTVTGPLPVPATTAAAPTVPAANVIALYGTTYTSLHTVNTWRTDWTDGRTLLDTFNIGTHPVMKYSNLYFAGVEFVGANMVDATQMTHFHMDVWTPDATEFRVKLVDFGADGGYAGGDDSEAELAFNASSSPVLGQGQWVGLEIPMTAFTAVNANFNRGHLAQMVISGTGGSTVYVDNVYFHK